MKSVKYFKSLITTEFSIEYVHLEKIRIRVIIVNCFVKATNKRVIT